MYPHRAASVWSSIIERARREAIPASIRHVCEACAADLPAGGVAVVLASSLGTRELAYATDPLGEELVEVQTTYGEGPALDAVVGFDPVLVPDLNAADALVRWPMFVADAIHAGAQAEFSIPLRLGAVRLGALDLHRTTPGALPADSLTDAVIYADAALAVVLSARANSARDFAVAEDEYADRGAELHQAAGMVSVQPTRT